MRSRHLVPVLVLGSTFAGAEARAQATGGNVLQNAPVPTSEQSREGTHSQPNAAGAALTPDGLQGPPTPAVMYAVAGLDDRQLAQYLGAYRAHMAATWNTRYAVMSSLQMLERAMQNSDSDAVEYYQLLTGQLWQQVRTQDESFDLALGAILHKGQLRRYREWGGAWERGTRVQQRLDPPAASREAG